MDGSHGPATQLLSYHPLRSLRAVVAHLSFYSEHLSEYLTHGENAMEGPWIYCTPFDLGH